MSEFLDIPEFPGYSVDQNGRIKGKRGTILRPCINQGYYQVSCYVNKKDTNLFVHHGVVVVTSCTDCGGAIEPGKACEWCKWPGPSLEPNEDGDICCPSCGDAVPACYWPTGSDICRACERGIS